MLPSFGAEIGELMEAPQGRALQSVSLRGPLQHLVNKHRFTGNSVRHGWVRHERGEASQAASHRMCSSISGGTTAG